MAVRANGHRGLIWRKSSASAGVGECVEVAKSGSLVLTRDSRNHSGAVLELSSAQWTGLMWRIKQDQAVRG
jgi:Domain of unknown function (DUF397)